MSARQIAWPALRLSFRAVGRRFDGLTDRELGVQLGLSRNQVQKYRERGLNPVQADRLATHLGLHPSSIWGKAYDWAEECTTLVRRQNGRRNGGVRARDRARCGAVPVDDAPAVHSKDTW